MRSDTKIAQKSSGNQTDRFSKLIYLDYNGSTPLVASARAAMLPFLDTGYGNPSSGHWASEPARLAVEDAREQVARLIGADASEIVLTSGATEANNLAIKGCLPQRQLEDVHVISSAIEHDSVLRPLRALRRLGVKMTLVPVDEFGTVDVDAIEHAIRPQTRLISIMMANNEVGTIQPVARIAEIAKQHGVPFHTDAAQAIGKMDVCVRSMRMDMLSIAGHKFGAPNGVGALFVRNGQQISPMFHGGSHEKGRRAGTESALLAAGLAAAAGHARKKDNRPVEALRDYFWARLQKAFGDRVVLNGHPRRRVPNTLNVSFPGAIGADILAAMPEVAATTGSACHAGCIDMSHVLIAMGKSVENGLGAIRFSLGEETRKADINRVISTLTNVVSN